nr:MAG: DNA pilot protein [Microvirus Sku111]
MGFFSGLAGAVTGAVGGLLGAHSDRKHQDKQQAHMDELNATRYQTTVKDLEAAGLNKALAYGGMSPPSPTQVTGNNRMSETMKNAGELMLNSSQYDVARQNAEVQRKNIQADTDLKKQEAINKEIEATGKDLDNQLKVLGKDTERLKQKLLSSQNQHELKKILNTEQEFRNLSAQEQATIIDTATKQWELKLSKEDPRNNLAERIEQFRAEKETRHLSVVEQRERQKLLLAQIQKLKAEGKITDAEAKSWENSIYMKNYKSVIGAISDTVGAVKKAAGAIADLNYLN